jgi:hypothetical protein
MSPTAYSPVVQRVVTLDVPGGVAADEEGSGEEDREPGREAGCMIAYAYDI